MYSIFDVCICPRVSVHFPTSLPSVASPANFDFRKNIKNIKLIKNIKNINPIFPYETTEGSLYGKFRNLEKRFFIFGYFEYTGYYLIPTPTPLAPFCNLLVPPTVFPS